MKVAVGSVIRALSIALDLTEISSINNNDIIEDVTNINYSEHKLKNHSQRTAYIAMEVGKKLNLSKESKRELYVAALLHDIGASNFFTMSHSSEEFIKKHCIIGAEITKNFPSLNFVSEIIMYHHENWNGSGAMKIKGKDIPKQSQIIRIADITDLLFKEKLPWYKQKEEIIKWINGNRGIIFSNEITDVFLKLSQKDTFWLNLANINYINYILDDLSPNFNRFLTLKDFVEISNIFSSIIDNKSKFTAQHSKAISNLSYSVSKYLNYSEEKCTKMKIAGLLHDIGKIAVPSFILDKPTSLTDDEFSIIKSHAYYTKIILDNIGGINDISEWASNHHEKLNGTGYPRCLKDNDISEESRILAVCDIYQALIENRPYRKGLTQKHAFKIIDEMVQNKLVCGKATNHLKNSFNNRIF